MRRLLLTIAFALLAGAANAQTVVGDWHGTLKVGVATLHLVLHITQDKDGLAASLDSPDQGALGVPVASIALNDRTMTFAIDVIDGSYSGVVSADGESIDGTWKQGDSDQTLPLVFTRAASR